MYMYTRFYLNLDESITIVTLDNLTMRQTVVYQG